MTSTEQVTRTLKAEILIAVGHTPSPSPPDRLIHVCLDALTRAAAVIVGESREYGNMLVAYFDAALLREG